MNGKPIFIPNDHESPVALNAQDFFSDRSSAILNKLRSRGYIINAKRIAFIAGICAFGNVHNPEDLFLYLKENKVPISITSVYNNLRMLVNANVMIKTLPEKRSTYVFHQAYQEPTLNIFRHSQSS